VVVFRKIFLELQVLRETNAYLESQLSANVARSIASYTMTIDDENNKEKSTYDNNEVI